MQHAGLSAVSVTMRLPAAPKPCVICAGIPHDDWSSVR
jgi:hypothetical protein